MRRRFLIWVNFVSLGRNLLSRNWTVVVHQNAIARTFQVLELAALEEPPKNDTDDEDQGHGNGHQEVHDFHIAAPQAFAADFCNRKAFNTTSSELADMPTPAIQGVTQPAMASGMAIVL